MNPTVSTYMRKLQLRSAASRWSGLSAEERREKMSELAKKRWAKRTSSTPCKQSKESCK